MKQLIIIINLLCTVFFPLMAQGYIQPNDNFHQYQVTHERTTLPTEYDSRKYGWVLEPRDQKTDGTCWAFSCATAWQILLHKNEIETGYLSAHTIATCYEGYLTTPITGGGNTRIANSMLARLEGIVLEDAVPYDYQNTECKSYSKEDVPAYILGWDYLPEDDATAIKKSIMQSGAVSASIYFNRIYYDYSTLIYKYTGESSPNHAVTLIGWDDSKQAWLAQNSWGDQSYNGGYLWISYQDTNVAKECTAYTQYTSTNSIDNVHHITTAGMNAGYGYKTGVVSDGIIEYDFEAGEQLVAIGTSLPAANTRINFTVLDLEAQAILYTSSPVTIPYKGFYKHNLETPLAVSGKICIAVTYYSETDTYIIPIESNNSLVSITPHPGNQWVDFNESGNWIPFGTAAKPYNLCIYAYTKENTTQINEQDNVSTRLFEGNQIANHAWDNVKNIRVCSMDGKQHKLLTPANCSMPSLTKGVYILVAEKLDGSLYTEKIWIQ